MKGGMLQTKTRDAIMTKDPSTNTVPSERRFIAMEQVAAYTADPSTYGASSLFPGLIPPTINWWEMGPKNVGGRTRALFPDLYYPNKLWAGGVSGGLWYCNDASVSSPVWFKKNDFFDNLAVTTIAQDPVNKQYMYFGTGEGWFNIDAVKGNGIWYSSDYGNNWTNTSGYFTDYYIQKIVVSATGTVYAATLNKGIIKSLDHGITWSPEAGDGTAGITKKSCADIEIAADGTIHAAFGFLEISGSGPTASYFVSGKLYKKTTSGTWTATGTTGFTTSGIGRIEIATAPSNANVLYAMATNGFTSISGIYKSINGGTSWTTCAKPIDADDTTTTLIGCVLPSCFPSSIKGSIPPNDFTRGQSWYDLAIVVDPSNANTLFVGGIDAFKSTNSGTSWTQISKWRNCIPCGSCQFMHADQHSMIYKRGSNSVLYFANDGGIYRTTNATASYPTITPINDYYNTTQYYSCALHPTNQTVLGGTQDNSTQNHSSFGFSPTTDYWVGDGGFCYIDKESPNTTIVSTFDLNYFKKNASTGVCSFLYSLATGYSGCYFINPADYDHTNNILYASTRYGTNYNKLARWSNITGTPTFTGLNLPTAVGTNWGNRATSALTVSPNTPSTLYIGSGAKSLSDLTTPKLFKITNANSTAPSYVDISSTNWTGGLTISSIAVQKTNENHIVVTFSNYGKGVKSIWETTTGGLGVSPWTPLDNDTLYLPVPNIPDMPIRWALFNPNNHDQLMLATEVGVWYTTDINGKSTIWFPSNNGLANVRVDMLKIRESDWIVVAATHGRGLFYTDFFGNQLNFSVDNNYYCPGNYRNFYGTYSGVAPSAWAWDLQTNGSNDVFTQNALSNNTFSAHITLSATTSTGITRSITRLNYMKLNDCCSPPCPVEVKGYDVKRYSNIDDKLSNIEIYPNPASNILNVSNLSSPSFLSVFDMNGNQVLAKEACESVCIVDISELSVGMYNLIIKQNHETFSKKFIVQH